MPHERFYFDGSLEGSATLNGSEFHHLARVLRCRIGDEVELVDGHGSLCSARIDAMDRESVHLEILSRMTEKRPSHSVILGLALMRMNRFEWLVEKATELGADAFYFFSADGSEKENFSTNQMQRLRQLMISAMKQSGRLFLPEIRIYSSLKDLLELPSSLYFGDTNPNAPLLLTQSPLPERILFVTGPESGFSEKETALLKTQGCGVKLHANILRAETAPLAALSILGQMRLSI